MTYFGPDTAAPFIDQTGAFRIDCVGIPGQAGAFSMAIANGRVSELRPMNGPVELLCIPAFADLHMHANRAFSAPSRLPATFADAVDLASDFLAKGTVQEFRENAERLFRRAASWGTQKIRTHADIGPLCGLEALRGTLEAADAASDLCDVEVVAFAGGTLDPAEKGGEAMLRDAVAAGADLLGAVPALNPDGRVSIDAILDIAVDLDVGVDLHLDEHLEPADMLSEHLTEAVIQRGLQGRVWLSHGCALTMLSGDRLRTVAERLAAAEITLISLPTTNLYLQDRDQPQAPRKGLAPLRMLFDAGVSIRLASDNIQDAFYPYGSGDMLEIAGLAATAGQFEEEERLLKSICDGELAVENGAEANLVFVAASNLREAIADRSRRRFIFRKGELAQQQD